MSDPGRKKAISMPAVDNENVTPSMNYGPNNSYWCAPGYNVSGRPLPLVSNQPNYKHFTLDPRCKPCYSMEDAMAELTYHHGGYHFEQTCIKADGTEPKSGKYKFQCCIVVRDAHGFNQKCSWRGQIRREVQPSNIAGSNEGLVVFRVYTKLGNKHNHGMQRRPDLPQDQCGIPYCFMSIIKQYMQFELHHRNRSMLKIKAEELLVAITRAVDNATASYCPANAILVSHSYCIHGNHREHLKVQIRGHLQQQKMKYICVSLGLSSNGNIGNADSLARVLSNWRLQIPATHRPGSNFTNADDLASALNATVDQMFVVDLTQGDVFQRFQTMIVGQNESAIKEFRKKMEQSFLVISPTGLFMLLNLALRQAGTRQICVDGTGGTCIDKSTMVILGSLSVKYRESQRNVTASFRPIAYLHLGGERYYCCSLALHVLRDLCWLLHRVELKMDFGTSDHAETFLKGNEEYHREPRKLDPPERIASLPADDTKTFDPMGDLCATLKMEWNKGRKRPAGPNETEEGHEEAPMKIADAVVPNGVVSSDGCIPDEIVSSNADGAAKKQEEIDWVAWRRQALSLHVLLLGVTLCYFHSQQHYAKNDGCVRLFRDKSFCQVPKKRRLKGEKSEAQKQSQLIHHCKTVHQRAACTELVVRHWTEDKGESAAGRRFLKMYCTGKCSNINYNCARRPGVLASNNSNESFNHHKVKGDNAPIDLNVSLSRLIVDSFPSLLTQDAADRGDPCVITIPNFCSVVAVVVSMFMKESVDVVPVMKDGNGRTTGWIANIGYKVGVPLTDKRLEDIRASLAGYQEHFENLCDADWTFADTAKKMISVTRSTCCLVLRHDGEIVGDCEDCVKKLGYNCPAAAFLRNKHGKFPLSLEERRMVPCNTRFKGHKSQAQGNRSAVHGGGLGLGLLNGRVARGTLPMLESDEEYLASLEVEQKREVMKYLGLSLSVASQDSMSKQKGYRKVAEDNACLVELSTFGQDPATHRAHRKKEYQENLAKRKQVMQEQAQAKKMKGGQEESITVG